MLLGFEAERLIHTMCIDGIDVSLSDSASGDLVVGTTHSGTKSELPVNRIKLKSSSIY